mgnify:CR=1 FL=1
MPEEASAIDVYYDMDKVIASALRLVEKELK